MENDKVTGQNCMENKVTMLEIKPIYKNVVCKCLHQEAKNWFNHINQRIDNNNTNNQLRTGSIASNQ